MNKRILTDEEKALIMQDYKNPEIKAITIREKWKLSSKQMTALIEEMGGEFRVPNNHKPRTKVGGSKSKVCPVCRKKIEIAGAKFCPFCATDIRGEAELLKDDVQKLYSLIRFLPAAEADKAGQIVGRMLDYLRKEAQK